MLVLAAAVVLAVTGWLFALPEAAVLAVCSAVTVLFAWVWVRIRRPTIQVRRVARPGRCRVGDNCQIQLRCRNPGPRTSAVVMLMDDVGRHGVAKLHLGPLSPGGSAVAAYSLPADRRGLHRVGPLRVTTEDPFQLARSTAVDGSHATVIVLPRTWDLTPLGAAPGEEPEAGSRTIASRSTVDEEFSALRAYVPGDDIRRIHWRSTARAGTPVVRQFDLPWQHRSTVVVDQLSHDGEGAAFERAVSVAASLVEQAAVNGELIRLVTTGVDSVEDGFVSAGERLDMLMDRLAALSPINGSHSTEPSTELSRDPLPNSARSSHLVRVVADLAATASGRLVVCGDHLSGAELLDLLAVSNRFGARVVVTTSSTGPVHAAGPTGSGPAGIAAGSLTLVHWDGSEPFDRVWQRSTQAIGASTGASTGRATG